MECGLFGHSFDSLFYGKSKTSSFNLFKLQIEESFNLPFALRQGYATNDNFIEI